MNKTDLENRTVLDKKLPAVQGSRTRSKKAAKLIFTRNQYSLGDADFSSKTLMVYVENLQILFLL